jgi:hypothetical protein
MPTSMHRRIKGLIRSPTWCLWLLASAYAMPQASVLLTVRCLYLETSETCASLQNLTNAAFEWTKVSWTKILTHRAHCGYPLCATEGSAPTVAPWRRGSTLMSQTCDFWQVSYRKRHPVNWGWSLTCAFIGVAIFFACDSGSKPVM